MFFTGKIETAFIPVVNVAHTSVTLYPCSLLGLLMQANTEGLPSGISEHAQTHIGEGGSIKAQIQTLDLSVLSTKEQEQVRAFLLKHEPVFSVFEGDLGCTNLISREIPLRDHKPIRQRYRSLPPSDYEAVKACL